MWSVQAWVDCWVAIRDNGKELYRFSSHAKARAYAFGRNRSKSHADAMKMAEKEK